MCWANPFTTVYPLMPWATCLTCTQGYSLGQCGTGCILTSCIWKTPPWVTKVAGHSAKHIWKALLGCRGLYRVDVGSTKPCWMWVKAQSVCKTLSPREDKVWPPIRESRLPLAVLTAFPDCGPQARCAAPLESLLECSDHWV